MTFGEVSLLRTQRRSVTVSSEWYHDSLVLVVFVTTELVKSDDGEGHHNDARLDVHANDTPNCVILVISVAWEDHKDGNISKVGHSEQVNDHGDDKG